MRLAAGPGISPDSSGSDPNCFLVVKPTFFCKGDKGLGLVNARRSERLKVFSQADVQAIEGGGFVGYWREVAGMTVRKRTLLVVVCGFGALHYMFFVTCPAGDCLWGSPPLWAIAFDVHLRACATPIAHGVGS